MDLFKLALILLKFSTNCQSYFFTNSIFRLPDGPSSSVLQEVALPIIPNGICEDMYYEAGYSTISSNIDMCAGYRKGGKDSCGVNTAMLSQNHPICLSKT